MQEYRAIYGGGDDNGNCAVARAELRLQLHELQRIGQVKLKAHNISKLITHLLTHDPQPVKWLHIRHRPFIDTVLTVAVDGLNLSVYQQYQQHCTLLHQLFNMQSCVNPYEQPQKPHATENTADATAQSADSTAVDSILLYPRPQPQRPPPIP